MPEKQSPASSAGGDALIDRSDLDRLEQDGGQDASADAVPAAAMDAQFPDFTIEAQSGAPAAIDMLMDVDLEVKIELGRAQMAIEEVLLLQKGSVVELDKLAGDPVDILVNDRRVARGEILVVNDNFCVRITEILDPEAGLKVGETHD